MLDWATASEQFWSHVEPAGDCWIWTGEFVGDNATVGNVDGVVWSAHRFAFIDLVGPIPAGTHVSRACRDSACVNPDHLEFAGPGGNFWPSSTIRRKVAKMLCSKGHLYDKANIYRQGKRVCRLCRPVEINPRPKKRRKRVRKAKVVVHGKVSTYGSGCREQPLLVVHGKVSTYGSGCRCDECKAAASEYRRAYYARRKNPGPEPRPCAWCKAEFQPYSDKNVFCSAVCRWASRRAGLGPYASRQLPKSPQRWALVTEWYIEPDPDLVMLQAIAAQSPSRSKKRAKRQGRSGKASR